MQIIFQFAFDFLHPDFINAIPELIPDIMSHLKSAILQKVAAAPLIKAVVGASPSLRVPCSEYLYKSVVIAVVVCKVLVLHVLLNLLSCHVAFRYVHPDAFRSYDTYCSDDVVHYLDFINSITFALPIQFIFEDTGK